MTKASVHYVTLFFFSLHHYVNHLRHSLLIWRDTFFLLFTLVKQNVRIIYLAFVVIIVVVDAVDAIFAYFYVTGVYLCGYRFFLLSACTVFHGSELYWFVFYFYFPLTFLFIHCHPFTQCFFLVVSPSPFSPHASLFSSPSLLLPSGTAHPGLLVLTSPPFPA